jgi:hypothetical protein
MFTEDLTVFLNTGDFAIAATYDGSTTVNGIFDAEYADAFGVAGTSPAFTCRAADIPAAGVGNTLVVSGVTYRIRNRMPQDDGAVVILKLEAQ